LAIALPLYRSPVIQPRAGKAHSCLLGARPAALKPDPHATTTPQCFLVPARSAACISLLTSTRWLESKAPRIASRRRTTSSGRSAPARQQEPMAISSGPTCAESIAAWAARLIASTARGRPTIWWFDPSSLPKPRMRPSSFAIIANVLDPPPSTPST
jgi:hypothetical protein